MVQAGHMIARRFRLSRTEEYDIPGTTRFVARDTRLAQDVTVDIISSLAPSSVVRSARRAQVLRDRRLTRVIATGSERRDGDRLTYVVSERPVGVRLDKIVGRAAFLPATAAAIVGEAAATLDVLGRSGAHHGMIRPRSLTVTARGRVILSGLGVEGELGSQAGLGRGRSERVDAIALARIFVTAVTAMDADDVTVADLPDDLPWPARELCEALLRGSGPLTLAQITDALGVGDTVALRTLVSEAPRLSWPRAPEPTARVEEVVAPVEEVVAPVEEVVAPVEEVVAPVEEVKAAADADLDGPSGDGAEFGAELGAGDDAEELSESYDEGVDDAPDEPVDPSSARLHTRFGGAVDDIDEFHDIVTAQNVESAPSVAEAILERLHRRFPRSVALDDLAGAAHRRAQAVAPFNVGPLVVAMLIVVVFVAAVIAAAVIAQPIDAPFDDSNNPSHPYPEYTVRQTPPSDPAG